MPNPLHVQTAKALGWVNLEERSEGKWWGLEPHGGLILEVPRYDRSWCSAGPLCERFGISLWRLSNGWEASSVDGTNSFADTPTESVAGLIVELSKQGKLTNG